MKLTEYVITFIKTIAFFIPTFFFKGKKYYCNICGFNAHSFLPRGNRHKIINELKVLGAGFRYANCKNCDSSDRDRLIFAYFEFISKTETLTNQTLLHIAPEPSLSNVLEKKFGLKIVKLDAKMKGYKFDYGRNVMVGDLTCLTFENKSFDWLIANHVLEYILDENAAILEIIRVLKPNGRAILQVPLSLELPTTLESEHHWSSQTKKNKLGQFDALRLYGLDMPKRFVRKNFIHQPLSTDFITEPKKLKLFPNEFLNLFRKMNDHQ